MYRIMYLLLDWEGCRLLAAGALIFSGISAGRDQELLSRAAPPFMTGKATLVQISWGSKGPLPCLLG